MLDKCYPSLAAEEDRPLFLVLVLSSTLNFNRTELAQNEKQDESSAKIWDTMFLWPEH